jgi:hypothetical protein
MTADSIRKLVADHLQGEIDGSLDPNNTRNLLLAEIAAQLAELNARAEKPIEELRRESLARTAIYARLRLAAKDLLPYLGALEDVHNSGGGWKSDECIASIVALQRAIAEAEK